MQNTKIFAVTGLILTLGCVVLNHAFGRMSLPLPKKVPVATFARQIDGWSVTEDHPIDPEVQKMLSTATLEDRTYIKAGQTPPLPVNLVLVTATQYQDFHDPNWCFPAQGWKLSDHRTLQIGSQTVSTMTATQGGISELVLYWWAGQERDHETGLLARLQQYRKKIIGATGSSLFVRVTIPGDAAHPEPVIPFVQAILPEVKRMTDAVNR